MIDDHEAVQQTTKGSGGKTRRLRAWNEGYTPYLFILPFILVFLVFFIGPALYSLVLSFFKFRGYGKMTFVGFENYSRALNYHVFWSTLQNTLFYWMAHALPMMGISFALAVIVNSKLIVDRHKNIFKPLIFLPKLVAVVAGALVFQNFFGTHTGALNVMLGKPIPWLEDMRLAKWAVVILMIWKGIGYWFVIFLANLTSISDEIREAATVDGASAWQQLRHITIPLMRNAFLFAFIVDAVATLRLFAEPNILGGRAGALAPVEMAPILNLVVSGIRSARFGDAAAVGWLLFLITMVVTGIQYLVLGNRKGSR
jgi:ABC-type sugar transport system permease subunit